MNLNVISVIQWLLLWVLHEAETVSVIQIILGTHGRHLYQRVDGAQNKHNVRPSNLRENFTILIKKCRSKLEYLIFEMLYIRI